MKTMVPEQSGASVILLGSFNPVIFQPEWFARQQLLTQAEAEAAKVNIIHPQVCQFETEQFAIQVTPEQFTATTKPNAISEPLRDLVAGIFYVLEHTPVTAMGINRYMHFKTESAEVWHRIGDNLAPKVYWQSVLKGRPGMENLMISSVPPDDERLKVNVTVEPSKLVTSGVYFQVNYHHAAPEVDQLSSFMSILRDSWEDKQRAALDIAVHIIQQAGENTDGREYPSSAGGAA